MDDDRKIAPPPIASYAIAVAGYTLPWVPAVIRSSVNTSPAQVLGIAIALAALIMGCLWLRDRTPRLARVLAFPLWLLLFGLDVNVAFYAWSMDPLYLAIAVVLSASAFLPFFAGKRLLALHLVAVAVMTVFVVAVLRHHSTGAALVAVCAGGAGMAAARPINRWLAAYPLSRHAMAFAVFAVLIFPVALAHYRFVFPKYLPDVIAQPGVRSIYSYADERLADALPQQVLFLAPTPGADKFILGPLTPATSLLFMTAGDAPRVVGEVALGGRASDNYVVDPDDPDVIYVGGGNHFFKVSCAKQKVLESLEMLPRQNVSVVRFDAKSDRFLVSYDLSNEVYVVSRRPFRVVAHLTAPSVVVDVNFDAVGDALLVNGRCFRGGRLDAFDAQKDMAHTGVRFWAGENAFGAFTLDPARRRIYIASTMRGRVRVLDADRLQRVEDLPVEIGVRNIGFDAARGWVLISGYISGRLFVYDARQQTIAGSLFLGPRLRWINVDVRSGRWYATSSVGGFEIDPNAAFPSASRAPADSLPASPVAYRGGAVENPQAVL